MRPPEVAPHEILPAPGCDFEAPHDPDLPPLARPRPK